MTVDLFTVFAQTTMMIFGEGSTNAPRQDPS